VSLSARRAQLPRTGAASWLAPPCGESARGRR